MITDQIITSRIDMMNVVFDDYRKHDEELSSYHFDFNVSMLESEILKAYAKIQEVINGDTVVRIEQENEQATLIPPNEFNKLYQGNCKDFLEQFNGQGRFLRFNEDEIVDFIW